jgi:ubiquinone/menaquinone biosynthesis C-methylase UbiE
MMADTGATVTGIDLAPNMVKLASELNPNIEFKEANVDDLPFDSNSFDAVLVNYAIHHFARPDQGVKEIYRVLKSGGRFVFAGPLEHFGFWAFIAGITAHHTMDELAHGPIYLEARREDYEKLVVDAGFGEYDVTEREITLHQDSLDAVLKTGWEMCELAKLSQETQDKIRMTTMENASQYKTENGYDFPDRIVVGVATK